MTEQRGQQKKEKDESKVKRKTDEGGGKGRGRRKEELVAAAAVIVGGACGQRRGGKRVELHAKRERKSKPRCFDRLFSWLLADTMTNSGWRRTSLDQSLALMLGRLVRMCM